MFLNTVLTTYSSAFVKIVPCGGSKSVSYAARRRFGSKYVRLHAIVQWILIQVVVSIPKKLNASWSHLLTNTCKNIAFTSATTAMGDSLKRYKTEVKSGPTINPPFRDLPSNLKLQSNTILNF